MPRKIFGAISDFTPPRTSRLSSTRKGYDEVFRAQMVVYVGFNVHTQAMTPCRSCGGRKGRAVEAVADEKGKYVPVNLRQFDLFPQIACVESIAF